MNQKIVRKVLWHSTGSKKGLRSSSIGVYRVKERRKAHQTRKSSGSSSFWIKGTGSVRCHIKNLELSNGNYKVYLNINLCEVLFGRNPLTTSPLPLQCLLCPNRCTTTKNFDLLPRHLRGNTRRQKHTRTLKSIIFQINFFTWMHNTRFYSCLTRY